MVLLQLIKRNIRLYFRDRMAVFFSFLSTLIVLVLMLAFLGEGNVDSVMSAFGETSAEAKEHADRLVVLWVIAGILVVNAFSVAVAMVGFMVEDTAKHKLAAFFATPVKREIFVLGYIFSANIVALLMCLFIFAVGEIYILAIGGSMPGGIVLGKLLLGAAANIFTASSMAFLFACLIKSMSAWGGFATLIGTLMGFLSAIYVPYGTLAEVLQNTLRILPMFQGTSVMRELLTETELSWFNAPKQVKEGLAEYMGITVNYGDVILSYGSKLLYLFAWGVGFLLVSFVLLKRKNVQDR